MHCRRDNDDEAAVRPPHDFTRVNARAVGDIDHQSAFGVVRRQRPQPGGRRVPRNFIGAHAGEGVADGILLGCERQAFARAKRNFAGTREHRQRIGIGIRAAFPGHAVHAPTVTAPNIRPRSTAIHALPMPTRAAMTTASARLKTKRIQSEGFRADVSVIRTLPSSIASGFERGALCINPSMMVKRSLVAADSWEARCACASAWSLAGDHGGRGGSPRTAGSTNGIGFSATPWCA